MEPIIRLLGADVKDVQGGVAKLLVPKGNREKFESLYLEHENDVARLNEYRPKSTMESMTNTAMLQLQKRLCTFLKLRKIWRKRGSRRFT